MITKEEKALDMAFENAINVFLKTLANGFKSLKNKGNFIGFIAVMVLTFTLYSFKDKISQVPMLAVFAMPFVYLCAIGYTITSADKEQNKLFLENGFVSPNGMPPKLIKEEKASEQVTQMLYTSMIPINVWRNKADVLEMIFDRSIIKIEEGKGKRLAIVSCLPKHYKFPTLVEWSDELLSEKDGDVIIGVDQSGLVSFNLNKYPHLISAGETGSGKSVILRCILWQLINQGCRSYMIDFKGGVEFGIDYEQFGEVVTERQRAIEVLDLLVKENSLRLKMFRESRVKNLAEYNKKFNDNLSRIVVVIDEIAEMLDSKGATAEVKEEIAQLGNRLSTLARLARAPGIHLLLGAQRPDANVLPGQIKNNIPIRICGRFADTSASEIVLGNTDAKSLPDIKGRFIYKVGADSVFFQAFLFNDDTMLHSVNVEQGRMLCLNEIQNATTNTESKEEKDFVGEKQGQAAKKNKRKKAYYPAKT